jgi:hypothetical protein
VFQVAQLQKKKKAAAASEKSTSKKVAKDDAPNSPTKDTAEDDEETLAEDEEEDRAEAVARDEGGAEDTPRDLDEDVFNKAIKSAAGHTAEGEPGPLQSSGDTSPPELANDKTRAGHGRQPSLSLQSKLRSSSFRQSPASGPLSPSATANLPPLTPDEGTIQDIYRKQAARLEELEKENKRLAKEVTDGEHRWRKSEEELEELREGSVESQALKVQAKKSVDAEAETIKLRAEIATLTAEITTLTRERAQRRQSISDRRSSGVNDETEAVKLRHELYGKDSTIAEMELEISKLRSQVNTQTQGCDRHGEQISALQEALSRSETKLKATDIELADTKKALTHASEKAVSEGTQKTSKDTKIRTLEKDMAEAITARDEIVKKADGLEKKVEAMNKLHREAEARNASKLSAAETGSREAGVLKAKLASLENENLRLKEEKERRKKRSLDRTGGADDVDELEDEERDKLEKRIRELEGEVFDLRRGIWRDRRKGLQEDDDVLPPRPSQDEDFDEVDLSGPGSRRRSMANTLTGPQQKHSGFSQVLNSGLAAFRAATTSPDSQQHKQQTRPRNDSLLEEFDDDTFDETAFAQAQREEEARKMVEHVREVKRKLKDWEGWRLDLVDLRRAGGTEPGFGEIFEV